MQEVEEKRMSSPRKRDAKRAKEGQLRKAEKNEIADQKDKERRRNQQRKATYVDLVSKM